MNFFKVLTVLPAFTVIELPMLSHFSLNRRWWGGPSCLPALDSASRTLPLPPELGMLLHFTLLVSLAEAFQSMWPDWVGLGWRQGGLWGEIGELSWAGAVPSELTASRSCGCLSQTPASQPGPVAQN